MSIFGNWDSDAHNQSVVNDAIEDANRGTSDNRPTTSWVEDAGIILTGLTQGHRDQELYDTVRNDPDVRDSGGGGGSGGCFLSSACFQARGLPDNCAELTTLRQFRDQVLLSQDEGKCLVADYYSLAPALVQAIDAHPNASGIYERIYTELVTPTLGRIEAGDYSRAIAHYREFTLRLNRELRN